MSVKGMNLECTILSILYWAQFVLLKIIGTIIGFIAVFISINVSIDFKVTKTESLIALAIILVPIIPISIITEYFVK